MAFSSGEQLQYLNTARKRTNAQRKHFSQTMSENKKNKTKNMIGMRKKIEIRSEAEGQIKKTVRKS